MKVSIILPTYNRASMLNKAIDSTLNQTFKDFELIIVDNYSTDNTESVVKSYDDKRISYFKNQNNGLVSINRNYGIQKSCGEYIAFLDDDDLWLPEKLEKQVKLLDSNKKLGLVYSRSYVIDDRGNPAKPTYFRGIKLRRGHVFNELLVSNFIPQLTVLTRRDALDKVGKFDLQYKIAQDYDLWLRIANHYTVDFIDQPLAKYRFHGGSTSQKDMVLSFQEEIRIKEQRLNQDRNLKRALRGRIMRRKALLYLGMFVISMLNILKYHNRKSLGEVVNLARYFVGAKV